MRRNRKTKSEATKKRVKSAGKIKLPPTQILQLDKPVPVTSTPPGGYSSALRSHLCFCLYKTAIRLRALLDQSFLDFGLIAPQFGVLSVVENNGPMSQVDISQRMSIDKATMVKLIDGLEARNYVRRTPHPQDRRVRMVEITAAGRTTYSKMFAEAKKIEVDFTARLTNEERTTLHQLTARLLE